MGIAVGYIRVSSTKQAERGTSLDEQRERIAEFCASHDLMLESVVADEGRSGGVKDGDVFGWESRPTLMEIMRRAEAGEIAAVVVSKFDRLSRDHLTTVAVRRMLAKSGVQLFSAGEENGDSAEAELQQTIMAGVAQYERHLIRQRLQLGKARRKAEGRHVHGRVPYGYVSEGGALTPIDAEATVVKGIFREAAAGRSSGRITRDLNTRGISPRSASAWSPVTIRGILHNEVYCGVRYGRPKSHPALVSRRAFNSAQATLAKGRKR